MSKRTKESFYDQEAVIGGAVKYHRESCPAVALIAEMNRKRLRSWKAAVEQELKPCLTCNPYHPSHAEQKARTRKELLDMFARLAPARTEPVLAHFGGEAEASRLEGWRRQIVRAVGDLEAEIDPDSIHQRGTEGIAQRIKRLTQANRLPRPTAACMRVITELRNAVEYDNKHLTAGETAAAEAAWTVVHEWMDSRQAGLQGPSE